MKVTPCHMAALCAGFLLVSTAHAEVLDATDSGFTIVLEKGIDSSRSRVYQAFVKEVGSWWSPELTVSGYAESLYIDARPMGCFCEALANGGLVHLVVTLVDADNMLRLTGGFGPLGLMGVSGNMTVEFFDSGEGTRVRLQYAVGGYSPGGLENTATQVDSVLLQQLVRLGRWVETGSAEARD